MYDKQIILERLNKYIESVPDPMIQEFCIDRDNPSRDTIQEWCKTDKDFSVTVKRLLDKQELFLARAKDINPVMAIFRLKQPVFGYKDKQDVTIDGNITQTIKPILLD